MARSTSRPRLNLRILGALLIVALPLLIVGSVIIVGIGQAAVRDAYGRSLAQLAERTAATVDTYVFRQIISASQLAKSPTVRDTAEASVAPAEASVIRDLDTAWQRNESAPSLAGLLENRCSRYLAEVTRDDAIYKEILLTDRAGRLVCASGRTSDYYQADEPWWPEAFGDGLTGRVAVGDVTWDESSRVSSLDIAVPVLSANRNAVVGVMKVVTDSRELFSVLAGVRPGEGGKATLVRPDASIVFERSPTQDGAQFFAADLFRERVAALQRGDPLGTQFFSASPSGSEARWMVAIAPSQLGTSYPNLHWLVAVAEPEAEIFAPIRAQGFHWLMLVLTTALAVVIIALWFSLRLARSPFDTDFHLVEHGKIPGPDGGQEERRPRTPAPAH